MGGTIILGKAVGVPTPLDSIITIPASFWDLVGDRVAPSVLKGHGRSRGWPHCPWYPPVRAHNPQQYPVPARTLELSPGHPGQPQPHSHLIKAGEGI